MRPHLSRVTDRRGFRHVNFDSIAVQSDPLTWYLVVYFIWDNHPSPADLGVSIAA